jgi:hypothetical protein
MEDGLAKACPATGCHRATYFGDGCIADQEAIEASEVTLSDGTVTKIDVYGK